jgi:hypothetical protein
MPGKFQHILISGTITAELPYLDVSTRSELRGASCEDWKTALKGLTVVYETKRNETKRNETKSAVCEICNLRNL